MKVVLKYQTPKPIIFETRTQEGVAVYCSMIPEDDIGLGDKSSDRIYINIMKQNTCVIE